MIWDWVNLYHMYLFRLILQAKSFVLFYLWYSSCFKVKCWFHTFQAVFSYFYGSTNPFDHRDCHVNSFQPVCFSSSGSDHFNICEINSKFSQRYPFHPSPSCLCFPALPPFFFKDSDFLIMYPFICGKSLHSFLSMFLSGDFPWRCSTVSSSSSFIVVSSPVDPIQAFDIHHIPFLVSNAFSCRCTS